MTGTRPLRIELRFAPQAWPRSPVLLEGQGARLHARALDEHGTVVTPPAEMAITWRLRRPGVPPVQISDAPRYPTEFGFASLLLTNDEPGDWQAELAITSAPPAVAEMRWQVQARRIAIAPPSFIDALLTSGLLPLLTSDGDILQVTQT
ncbi:hypothetical protein [Falsiroseomonas sp.]|uniref:hypothetical protein n=1 Tax=Falsiroseomonas sp. TaxID=2870721 RepID=UPI003F6EE5B6